ncbi:uncharacterized protein LOC126367053 [Pectinophora gossypiella]|uniref:uncharacterized protein LOC126367053 n=1 Tax=Pectinophora gossypiella TaxID=13191 RepID=UPI00214EF459|nr:uncharacterized protein LOC126367053 [Pectinophora gossypiella]
MGLPTVAAAALRNRHTKPADSTLFQSPGCTIPSLDFLDPTIRNLVEYPADEKCPNEAYPLLGSNETHIWVINETKGVIDLKGYGKTSDKMLLNVLAMLVGKNVEELQKTCWPSPIARLDRCPFIWDRFKDVGYYTALLEDSARFSIYETLLKKLSNSGYLNDTFLILVSDEGIKSGDIRKRKQGRLEQRLPFLYILPPTSLRKKFSLAYENLKENAERLTTPYDLYNTLIDLLDLSAIKNEEVLLRNEITHYHDKSVSLFLQIPDNRTCQSADINKYLCGCVQSSRISNQTSESRGAASFLVRHLNEILGSYPQCARLALESILQAVEYTIPYESDKEWHDVTVVVRVKPGGGVFEGTMRHYKDGDWTMLSPVSRFNMYSELSFCVKQYWLKMYCYCLL